MEQWKEYKLGDLYEVHNGLSKSGKFFGAGFPFLSFKTVFNNYFLPSKLPELVQSDEKEQNRYDIKRGDVFVTRTSETPEELGMSSVALKDYPFATYNGFTKRLRPKDISIVHPEFIGYYLRSFKFRAHFYGLASSMSTRASLANGDLLEMKVFLPSIGVQKSISTILKSLDDKIELNRRINDNLEQQAQALFKSWFVDFEPFKDGEFVESELGMIPKGWRIEPLCNWGQIICGKTPSKANKNFYNGDIPFIKIPDMHDHVYIIKTEDHLSNTGDESQKNKRIPPYSILVSCIATVGLVAMNTCMAHTNQQINSIIPFYDYTRYYLYQTLGSMSEYIQNLGRGGTATLNVNSRFFGNIKIITPPTDVLKQYSLIISSMFEQIEKNEKTTQSLDSIRDTLLPRLMSGELKPSGITL